MDASLAVVESFNQSDLGYGKQGYLIGHGGSQSNRPQRDSKGTWSVYQHRGPCIPLVF